MINITSLDEITTSEVQAQKELLTQLMQDQYPNIDLRHGVLHDLVQHINAIYLAKTEQEMDRWRASRSLLAITQNPELADNDTADHIFSNYNIDRTKGQYAQGTVVLEFIDDAIAVLPAGSIFTANGVKFTTTESYAIYDSETTTVSLSDRILHKLSSGNYGCSIPVIAVEPGTDGCVTRGTLFELDPALSGLATAYALDTFTGGVDTETNLEMIPKLQQGLAAPVWGTRNSIQSMIRQANIAPELVDISVIGYGDPEMIRDSSGIIPLSCGGAVDIYAKTNTAPVTKTITISAYVSSITCDSVIWNANIPFDSFPGFWRVIEILPENAYSGNSYELLSQSVTTSNALYSPLAAAYTEHQRISIQFATEITSKNILIAGDTQLFNCTLLGLEHIAKLNELIQSKEIKPLSCDVLVKAAIPCLLSVDITLQQKLLDPITDEQRLNIKTAIVDEINKTGFCANMSTADLATTVKNELTATQTIPKIQLTGIVLLPDGTIWRGVSVDQFNIPDLPDKLVTRNTTAFFTGLDSIEIHTVTAK